MSFLQTKIRKFKQDETKVSENEQKSIVDAKAFNITIEREFDPGSGRTLAACLTHASRTRIY